MAKEEQGHRLKEIGARIRKRRLELGMTQDDVRSATGLSKSFVSEVEAGETQASGLNYLKISQTLKVGLQWLLTGEAPESNDAHRPTQINPVVARVAEVHGWSYSKAKLISNTVDAVVARRSTANLGQQPDDEWVIRLGELFDQQDTK